MGASSTIQHERGGEWMRSRPARSGIPLIHLEHIMGQTPERLRSRSRANTHAGVGIQEDARRKALTLPIAISTMGQSFARLSGAKEDKSGHSRDAWSCRPAFSSTALHEGLIKG